MSSVRMENREKDGGDEPHWAENDAANHDDQEVPLPAAGSVDMCMNPALSLAPGQQQAYPPAGREGASDGESVPGTDNGLIRAADDEDSLGQGMSGAGNQSFPALENNGLIRAAADEDSLGQGMSGEGNQSFPTLENNGLIRAAADEDSLVQGMSGVGNQSFPALQDNCGAEEIGEHMPGLMERIMADMATTGSRSGIDLSAMAVMTAAAAEAAHRWQREEGSSSEAETRTTAGEEEVGDVDRGGREGGGGGQWKRRRSEGADDVVNDDLRSPPPRAGQPPSGPFVVGSQTDLKTESYYGETPTGSCTTSSGGGGGALMESSASGESGLEGNPFFGCSVPLDSFNWHAASLAAAFPDRLTLKKIALDCPATAATPRQQKVRTDLTLAHKIRLISVSETTGRSQRSLAAEFHISVGSVNNILRRKREYKEAFENKDAASAVKTSHCYRPPAQAPPTSDPQTNDLQRLIMLWVDMAKVKVKPLTWPMVLDKAREFAAKLKVSAHRGQQLAPPLLTWLHSLQQTMDIPVQASWACVGGGRWWESEDGVVGMWRKMLPFLVQGYQPEDVFTVTETTLYYKCLPDCCYVGGPVCQNCGQHLDLLEHRLTVLLCCNALGERLRPLVVSRHACPPCLRSVAVGDLPVVWCRHPRALITTDIFAAWLRSLETSMAGQRRHIALFMDMSPSHLSTVLLQHVSLKVYLDDWAHLLQPLSRGVVRHFKAFFRRRLLQTALAHHTAGTNDGGERAVRAVTELDAVFWIQDAWRTVSLDTIRTSFLKAAFPPHPSHPSSHSPHPSQPPHHSHPSSHSSQPPHHSTHPSHPSSHSPHPSQPPHPSTHPSHSSSHPSPHPSHASLHPSTHPSHPSSHPSTHHSHPSSHPSTHPSHPSTHPSHPSPHPSWGLSLGASRSEPLPGDFLHLVREAGRVFRFTPMDPSLYVDFDSHLPCHAPPTADMEEWESARLAEATRGSLPLIKTEPGLFADHHHASNGAGFSCGHSGWGEGEGGEEKAVPPSEALESLSRLKRFSANNIGLLTTVFELESVLLDSVGPSTHVS